MSTRFTYLKSGEVETTESFFSREFLNARIDSGQESNEGFDPVFAESRSEEWREKRWKCIKENELKYDEDVNQYITLTLSDLANPQNLSLFNEYLVGLNADAGQIAVNLPQVSQQYILYRINADYLLLNLGLFNRDTNLLGEAYFDKGETYYFSAASHLKKFKGGETGLSSVLEKLSLRFGKYVNILRHMKNSSDNYFSFHFQFSRPEMEKFENSINLEVRKRKDPGKME
ncbi:MAG: hypothetical protein V3U37_03280 [Nitrospinaceae bacterium]